MVDSLTFRELPDINNVMQVVGKYRLKFKGMVQSRDTYILIKLWVKSKNMKLNEAANEMRQKRSSVSQ